MGESIREIFKRGKGIIVVGNNKENIQSCQNMMLHFIDCYMSIKVLDNKRMYRKMCKEFKDINIINVNSSKEIQVSIDSDLHITRRLGLTYIPLVKKPSEVDRVINMSYVSMDTILSGIVSGSLEDGIIEIVKMFQVENSLTLDTAKDIVYSSIGYVVSVRPFKNIKIFKVKWDKETDKLDLGQEV